MEQKARRIRGLVEMGGPGHLPFFIPLVRAIEELHADKRLSIVGEDPSVLLPLRQARAGEAHADRSGVVGAEGAAAHGLDALDQEDVLVLDAPE